MLRSLWVGFAATLMLWGAAVAADASVTDQPSDAQIAAALDLETAMNAKATAEHMIQLMVPLIITQERKSHPTMSDDTANTFETAITDEMVENIDSLLKQEASLYAKHFTIDELHRLAAFFRSDLGARYNSEMPSLMNELALVGRQWAIDILPRVIERARKKMAEKGVKT